MHSKHTLTRSMSSKLLFSIAVATLTAILAPSGARADLVTNGGFETANFSGWTLGGALGAGIISSAHSGTWAAFLNGFPSDTLLSQNLATTVGTQYTVSYWLTSDGLTPNDFSVSFGGTTLTSSTNLSAFPYTQFSFNVTATSALTALVFGVGEEHGSFFLDDVSVNPTGVAAVPLPATFPLFATGLGALGLLGWRRKRKAQAAA